MLLLQGLEVQSWLLPQLVAEERPPLLIWQPQEAAGSSSSIPSDAASAVLLAVAAEIAALEAYRGYSASAAADRPETLDAADQSTLEDVKPGCEPEEGGLDHLASDIYSAATTPPDAGAAEALEGPICLPHTLFVCPTAAAATAAAAQHNTAVC